MSKKEVMVVRRSGDIKSSIGPFMDLVDCANGNKLCSIPMDSCFIGLEYKNISEVPEEHIVKLILGRRGYTLRK
jgi:hypothetical protein